MDHVDPVPKPCGSLEGPMPTMASQVREDIDCPIQIPCSSSLRLLPIEGTPEGSVLNHLTHKSSSSLWNPAFRREKTVVGSVWATTWDFSLSQGPILVEFPTFVHTMNDRSMKIRMPKMALTQRLSEGSILRNQKSHNYHCLCIFYRYPRDRAVPYTRETLGLRSINHISHK